MHILKTITIVFFSLLFISNAGCKIKNVASDGKIQVITTLFPQYDFAKQIAKDKINIRILLPPGIESHSFEPTPKDIADIRKAGLFIYTGRYMEPWAQTLIANTKSDKPCIVDASKVVILMQETHGGHHGGLDPHIWVDPVNAAQMVDNILDGLIKVDPANESFYRANAQSYKEELARLHADFTSLFKKTANKNIIYGGHFAFGYFVKRYGLTYQSPYEGFSPDAEPTPQKIASLIKSIKSGGTKYIYYEELIDPKIARVISEETGAKMLLLNGAHNVSKKELESNITYITIMRGNLERLKTGLGYSE